MARKIGTRKNKSRRYGKRGGMFGFGEETSTSMGPKKNWSQYFGFTSDEQAAMSLPPVQQQMQPQRQLQSPQMIGGQYRRRHVSSRAGGKRRTKKHSKRTRKH